MKYVKKSIPVEAVQIPITTNPPNEIPLWLRQALDDRSSRIDKRGLWIKTLEGTMFAPWGSYIIRGVKGELYPCRADIFEETYEEYKGD